MSSFRDCVLFLTLLCCVLCPAWSQSLRQNQTWPSRTYPGELEFPDHDDLIYFEGQLDGRLVIPWYGDYIDVTLTHNLRVSRLPAMVVEPSTIEDIQRSVLYARKYNLHLTIRSSGHDFIGRSTHDGSLNIYLKNMRNIEVKLNSTRNNAGEVKVQSGASWLEVYSEVDKHRGPDASGQKMVGRVVVGGSAHTVAMGGYTQGGGHSPIGRQFGLAVDNLLEATIVTVDAKIVTVNSTMTMTRDMDGSVTVSNDTSLFWAIRGGGGGTWGVVVDFTFRLHYAPERFRRVYAVFSTYGWDGKPTNKDTVAFVLNQISKLSPDWGGYIMTPSYDPYKQSYGGLVLFLNHQGSNASASNSEIDAIADHPDIYIYEEKFRDTFLDYEMEAEDPDQYVSYTFNSLVQPSSLDNDTTLSDYVDLLVTMQAAKISCTATLVGGNIANAAPGSTPVHPGFRSAIMATTCAAFWPVLDVSVDADIDSALKFAQKLYTFGQGSYINEPAEDMSDWKTRFWGSDQTYQSLLAIKKTVDPDNYLWCHNCVGSDLGKAYAPVTPQGEPGHPVHTYFQGDLEFDQIKTGPMAGMPTTKTTPNAKPTTPYSNPIIG